jgi:uncharacterized protein
MHVWFAFLALGLVAGAAAGILGIGGGLIMVPCLALFFGFSQHQAQGTSLAVMVPPIGILAAWVYYKSGYVDLRAAAFICLGFVLGGLAGSRFAVSISNEALRRIFGGALAVIGVYMVLKK